MTAILLVLLVVLVVLVVATIATYNGLVRTRNRIDNARSQIDVQLKRRHDLIPNLVETVKGYAAHERGTLEAVTAARTHAIDAASGSLADQAQAENALTGALKSLFAVAEAYPDLKANTNFLELQRQLAETENQISFARTFYNDAVAQLNKLVATIPWMFFSGLAGVSRRDFYEAPAGQQTPPTVSF